MARNRCRSTGNTVKEMSLRMRQLRMPAGPGESLTGLFCSDLSTRAEIADRPTQLKGGGPTRWTYAGSLKRCRFLLKNGDFREAHVDSFAIHFAARYDSGLMVQSQWGDEQRKLRSCFRPMWRSRIRVDRIGGGLRAGTWIIVLYRRVSCMFCPAGPVGRSSRSHVPNT